MGQIRAQYRADWTSREMRKRQRAVALYFIDRVGPQAVLLLFWGLPSETQLDRGRQDVCVLSWSPGLTEGRVPVCVHVRV